MIVLAAILLLQFSTELQSIWVLIAGLFTLFYVLHGGNFTEEYALPFQFGALLLFFLAERKGYSFWRSFGIGVMIALAFHLRQNLIGVGIAIGLLIVLTMLVRSTSGRYDNGNWFVIKRGAIYWHFLAGLWVYLFLFLQYIH